MVEVHSYVVRCYRERPGDANCPDVPAFGESLEDCIELAGQMLLAYANSPRRTPEQRPQVAHLEDDDGDIAARLCIVGPDQVERIDAARPARALH